MRSEAQYRRCILVLALFHKMLGLACGIQCNGDTNPNHFPSSFGSKYKQNDVPHKSIQQYSCTERLKAIFRPRSRPTDRSLRGLPRFLFWCACNQTLKMPLRIWMLGSICQPLSSRKTIILQLQSFISTWARPRRNFRLTRVKLCMYMHANKPYKPCRDLV